MDDLNEKIKHVFSDLRIRCAYNMPSFWANSGKDYKVIPTKYAKGYQDALEDAEREITEVLSEQTAKRIVGKSRDGMTLWYQCDMCNEPVDAQDDFCRGCGRRLIDG